MRRATLFFVVAVPLAGCSLLIDLQDVPPATVPDGAADVGIDTSQSDGGADVVVDAPLDPNDCGASHAVCASQRCVSGDCVRRVFVTGGTFLGSIGPDTECQTAGSKLGKFEAIVSVTDAGAKEKVGPSNAPFVLVDGTEIAANAMALFSDAGLEHRIDKTETGADAGPSLLVWTGTLRGGEPDFTNHCMEWISQSGADTVGVGTWAASDESWLYTQTTSCDAFAHLYCVEK